MFRYSLVLLAGLAVAGPAAAAGWADALFEDLSRDFGSVPRGPTLTHAFRLKNKTGGVVTIGNIRPSCGCVAAYALKNQLRPGEETAIYTTMDTTRFSGVRTVNIFVQFVQPQVEEVRLWVQANSRDDVSFSPDTVAFGQVRRGTTPEAGTQVTFYGDPNARITEVRCDSNYVKVAVAGPRAEGAEVHYRLTARLRADAPVGKWYTDIWVKTNNASMPRVRVPLTVEIESALSLSPSQVVLGQVKVGSQAERKVIVRGTRPFKITSVQGADAQLQVRDSTTESKPVHVLTVTLKGTKAGDVDRTLRILTDLKEDGQIDVKATGQIVP